MFKKVIFSLMILIVSVLCFGCVQIEASVTYLSSNQIIQTFKITLNKTTIINSGQDYTRIYNKVYGIIYNEVENFDKGYSDALSVLANSGIDGLKKAIVYGRVNETVIKETDGSIIITKEFDNVYAFMFYNYRNNIPEKYLADVPLANEIKQLDSAFVVSVIQECYTTFNGHDALIDSITQQLNQEFGTAYSINDANLVFKYLTPYRRLHSDGEIATQGGYYVHTWSITDPNGTITLSRTSASAISWYVLALSVTISLMVVVGVFMYVKDKIKGPPLSFENLSKDSDAKSEKQQKPNQKTKKQTSVKNKDQALSIENLSTMLHELNTHTVKSSKTKNSNETKKSNNSTSKNSKAKQ